MQAFALGDGTQQYKVAGWLYQQCSASLKSIMHASTSVSLPLRPSLCRILHLFAQVLHVCCTCLHAVLFLQALPLGIARSHTGFLVGCTNSTVQCFDLKGKRTFCVNLPSPILAMHGLETAQQKIAKCLVVSLANGMSAFVRACLLY